MMKRGFFALLRMTMCGSEMEILRFAQNDRGGVRIIVILSGVSVANAVERISLNFPK